jgi:hypothetical protein
MNEWAQGPRVRWRGGGHELEPHTDVLRFEVADLNRVITRAVADGELYREIQDAQGHPGDWQVLPMSCFAVTDVWSPVRLARDTGFTRFRFARAAALIAAGFTLWPTEIFTDGVPDPRNEVHYDLVVAAGPALIPSTLITGTPAERRTARRELLPRFEHVLSVLGEPHELDGGPDEAGSDPGRIEPA